MRIERLRIKNYRVLRDVTFRDLTPLTVLYGPNGSGKSTVFDVFAFLHQAFTVGLRAAWDERLRMDAIRSRGCSGPVEFEIAYRAVGPEGRERLVTYALALDQVGSTPIVASERLRWSTSPGAGRPREILTFAQGEGTVYDEKTGQTEDVRLAAPDLLAVSALGQFRDHPRVQVLRDFFQGWYLSYISAGETRALPQSGPEPHLSRSGDNLANVIQFLDEEHPDVLREIFARLGRRVPQLESVLPEPLADGRLLLRLKDKPFAEPILSRFASDGTLKLLAYLVVLHDPAPFPVIGIEEPENQLHPRLMASLVDEIRSVAGRSQFLVTTHSPEVLGAAEAKEAWSVHRGEDGFARVSRVSDDPRAMAMLDAGGSLGQLWTEGYLPGTNPEAW